MCVDFRLFNKRYNQAPASPLYLLNTAWTKSWEHYLPQSNTESQTQLLFVLLFSNLLWMILVNGTIYSNGSAQLLSRFVIADLPQHCHQSGCTQVCGPGGHYLTHSASGYAVLHRRLKAELLECLLSAGKTFFFPAGENKPQLLIYFTHCFSSTHKAHSKD